MSLTPTPEQSAIIEANSYEVMTPLDWVMYEFATIEYDFKIHHTAARRIESLFRRLYESNSNT